MPPRAATPSPGVSAPTSAVEGAGVLDNINSILNSIEWEASLIRSSSSSASACSSASSSATSPQLHRQVRPAGLQGEEDRLRAGDAHRPRRDRHPRGHAAGVIVNRAAWRPFVNIYTIIAAAAVGAVLLLVGVSILIAVRRRWAAPRFMFWYTIGLVLCEAAMTFLITYWIYSSAASPPTPSTPSSATCAHIDGGLAALAEPIQVTEGLVCKAYQLCCRDPALDIMETSDDPNMDDLGSGAGSGDAPPCSSTSRRRFARAARGRDQRHRLDAPRPVDAQLCAYTSGAPASLLFDPPVATCRLIETLDDSFSSHARPTFAPTASTATSPSSTSSSG